MSGALRLFAAGAGTGKTYTLCEQVAQRIRSGLDPRRVLATTFTRRAAAELKGRIQGHLLAAGMHDKAELMDLAIMGTVHGVGLQILSRFAFSAGLSPEMSVIEEGEEDVHIKALLDSLDPGPWERLCDLEGRLSLGKSEPSRFKKKGEPNILKLLSLKRVNAIGSEEFLAQMSESARRMCEVLGTLTLNESEAASCGLPEASKEVQRLASIAAKALAPSEALEDRAAFGEMEKYAKQGVPSWRELYKASKVGEKKGAFVQVAVADLVSYAGGVRRNPHLHRDIREYLRLLAEMVVSLEEQYQAFKRERGLLDFADLEERFLKLVCDPQQEKELKAAIGLVVVDEFQDTNPVRLAIFLRLRELAEESVWVGDKKQAIFGFNGTDPVLMREVVEHTGVQPEPVDTNRRSVAPLVALVNDLFTHPSVFGEEARVRAFRGEAPGSLERWNLAARKLEDEAAALAVGVKDLIAKGAKKSSIAVLVWSNSWGAKVAAALKAEGIPVLRDLPCFFSSAETAIAVAGLRLVASRKDGVAAATMLHLLESQGEGTPSWFAERLREAMGSPDSAPFAAHQQIAGLASIPVADLTPSGAVMAVIDALGLCCAAGRWAEPSRRSVNLDSLLALAAGFEMEAGKAGLAPTLSAFLDHLDKLKERAEDEPSTPPGLDAVRVVTYHSAKGLEWPVVVLTQLNQEPSPFLWDPATSGGNAAAGRPLEGRKIRFWPWPFGNLEQVDSLEDDALQTPEGQAAARLESEEHMRLLYVGFTRPKDKLILAIRLAELKKGPSFKHAWLDRLPRFGSVTSRFTVRRFDPPSTVVAPSLAPHRWFAPPSAAPAQGIPRFRSPSQAPAVDARTQVEDLPGEQPFLEKVVTDHWEDMGHAVHAYLGALPSMSGVPQPLKLKRAAELLAGYDVEKSVKAEALVAAGDRLESWVKARYPGAVWHAEVPLSAPARSGGRWSGTADLLLELPDGRFVLVDHKSSPVGRGYAGEKAKEYSGQLAAYEEALASAGLTVAERWVHMPLAGVIVSLQ